MFTSGTAVGSIQPYFLSQAAPLEAHDPLPHQPKFGDVVAQAKKAADVFARFLADAKYNVHVAIYDFRLVPGEAHDTVVEAINGAAKRGVMVRVAYDKTKLSPTIEEFAASGADPAPIGTETFLTRSGRFDPRVQFKPVVTRPDLATATDQQIAEEPIDPKRQIMHHKYILRDVMTPRAALLMGSANFTVDAWGAQENNMLVITDAPDLVQYYERDFGELWDSGLITDTGRGDSATVQIGKTTIRVAFAPGEGSQIDADIARLIQSARKRLLVASMVISSGTILGAVADRMANVSVFGGIYDGPEMAAIEHQWTTAGSRPAARSTPHRSASGPAKAALFHEIAPHLHAKASIPYQKSQPDLPHSFMHDKVAVVDDAIVTGSYNFSDNATRNAENILIIRSKALADQYADYITGLLKDYPALGS
jgi:phosphatidylserine/phosphatidylglycerophosphate/cardiolipin synthase-like enzyme